MSHSLSMLTVHLTWSTKYRETRIESSFESRLHQYIGGIAKNVGAIAHAVGGTDNHIHVLSSYRSRYSVADLARVLKNNSSRWVNENGLCDGKFCWQTGYGAFSVHTSQIGDVVRYIENQRQHHRHHLLDDEAAFLRRVHA